MTTEPPSSEGTSSDPASSGPPLPPLSYQTPGRVRGPALDWQSVRRFLGGFAAGCAVSALVWIPGWSVFVQNGSGLAMAIVPGMKFVAGIACVCIPGWRGFGGGLLLSIAVGFLIFFGTCAAHLGS